MSDLDLSAETLLAAETTLAALSEKMAEEYKEGGRDWPREWMETHTKNREALLRVSLLLIDRAEVGNGWAMPDIEAKAGELYDLYCEKVGGVAFNGDPLPKWSEFGSDETKQKQADAWRAVAYCALGLTPPG